MIAILLQLAGLFLVLSLLAVGSANSVLPDMQRAAVQTYHWMTDREFLDLFAISRVAPGPGSLIVALIGQKAAGLPGAAVATVAMFTPSCLLVHLVARVWHRLRDAAWRERAEAGLGPVVVGLILASALVLVRGTQHALPAYALTAAATLVLTATELHPLWVLGAGALAGWLLGL
ncbi:chromate transporter [Limobrevibacterium gyesilva]|uniref:Chromate transporter n=1 Tax=Limobrevibacterium gyesilva TaxID=2991712 RepID=A0AA41YJM5_9PROT|nr:chromate transporter [Limobrevibacterium gyesilva]MCW3473516.1 chromate transporter [Limobrevibacterium gyesilva]